MHNASRKWLNRLLEVGSLPASSIPSTAKSDISNILNAEFIKWQKSGAGAKYSISDETAIRKLLSCTSYKGDLESLTPKAKAVALHSDAHKAKDNSLLLNLSAASSVQWTNGEFTLDVKDYANRYGIASLVVRPNDNWHTKQPVGLVENLDVVLYGKKYCERVGFEGSFLFYSGWLSRALYSWLIEKERAPSFMIFADYDLVGIKNYVIAKDKLGDVLSIYVPDNLKELLSKYGNPEKLKSNTDRSLIESSSDPDVINIYETLLETGCGLDQESLLLD